MYHLKVSKWCLHRTYNIVKKKKDCLHHLRTEGSLQYGYLWNADTAIIIELSFIFSPMKLMKTPNPSQWLWGLNWFIQIQIQIVIKLFICNKTFSIFLCRQICRNTYLHETIWTKFDVNLFKARLLGYMNFAFSLNYAKFIWEI